MLTHYWFWLILVSLAVFILERLFTWRRDQSMLRPGVLQDIFWLAFNGYFFGLVAVYFMVPLFQGLDRAFALAAGDVPGDANLLAGMVLWQQVAIALVVADFAEWCVHNLLHRVPVLWLFHRVHHSIKIMDWMGNFRYHWMENVFYQTVKHLPMVLLGARWEALLISAVISTAIGHLNHSNLNISWGPFRYILNSPVMHIWHHDKNIPNKHGYNFAVVFSLWDWIFRTAYMPKGEVPKELGFKKEELLPESLWWRFMVPFLNREIQKGS